MSEHDPQKVFPEEVLDLEKQGIPLPTWFAGPLYSGNGSTRAVAAVEKRRAEAGAPVRAADSE